MNSNQFCICGSKNSLTKKSRPTFPNGKSVFLCKSCGTAQLYPYAVTTNSDDSIYQDENYLKNISEEEYYGYFDVFNKHIKNILNVSKSAQILDFGSGYSYYQLFFEREGYNNVHSVEINNHHTNFARNTLGLKNIYSSLNDLQPQSYDLIIANQVLEHLSEPISMVNNALFDLLKPNGMLCFAVPNFSSLNRIVLGNKWIGYSPDDHLWFLSEKSVKHIFSDSDKYSIIDISIKSAVNTKLDRYKPKSLIKSLYYNTFMRFFETINKGDQLMVTLKKQ